MSLLYIFDLFGTFVFAISGALAAGKKMDIFGVIVLALVTAVGGGTFRDLVLGATPVAWISDPNYILIAISAAIFTFFAARLRPLTGRLLLLADAFGLALVTVLGTQKALSFEVHPAIAVMLGAMSGVAGGMIRDTLANEIPLVLRQEIYATASVIGGTVFVLSSYLVDGIQLQMLLGLLATLLIRLAAIRYRVSLPIFIPVERRGKQQGDSGDHSDRY